MTQNIDALIYIPAGAAAATVPTKLAQRSRHPGHQRRPQRRGRARRHLHRHRQRRLGEGGLRVHHRARPAARARWSSSTARRAPRPRSTASKGCKRGHRRPTRASRSSPSSGRTSGARTRASRSCRTCCRPIPTSAIVFGQADALALGAAQAIKVANLSAEGLVGGLRRRHRGARGAEGRASST